MGSFFGQETNQAIHNVAEKLDKMIQNAGETLNSTGKELNLLIRDSRNVINSVGEYVGYEVEQQPNAKNHNSDADHHSKHNNDEMDLAIGSKVGLFCVEENENVLGKIICLVLQEFQLVQFLDVVVFVSQFLYA